MNMMTNIQMTPAEEMLGQMLPTRRVESFHYTDLRSLIGSFPAAISQAETSGDNYKRLVATSRLPIFDGKLFVDLMDELPLVFRWKKTWRVLEPQILMTLWLR